MLTAILEVALALLAAVGLMSVGWFLFGRWLLPMGTDRAGTLAVVNARGDGGELEQIIHSLLWLRRCDLWRGQVVVVDRGLDEEGRKLARLLCANSDELVLCELDDLAEYISHT